MSTLEQYEPKEVWNYFEKICSIPHGSGNMDGIADYCVKFANSHGLRVIQDDLKNIIIIKEATPGYENEAAIILQGHLDMVCEKRIDSSFDFLNDALVLESDGEYVWAKDTTLGGDDGIAVAYILALLAAKDIDHPRLEMVLTVDEEVGLQGALEIDLSMLQGKKLINLDSEEEGIIWISCAGGLRFEGILPMEYESREGVPCEIAITGLIGGHSGSEIHMGRANANLLMGRVLNAVKQKMPYGIAALQCLSKDNAIPRHTTATLIVDRNNVSLLSSILSTQTTELKKEYDASDAGIDILITPREEKTTEVLTPLSAQAVLHTLMNFPNGIQAMNMDIEGMVETSLNLGTVDLDEKEFRICICVRSAKDSAKNYLTERAKVFIEQLGGTYLIGGSYPGWAYKKDSLLRDTIVNAYEGLHGVKPLVKGIHAGLECGILSDKIENLDCVSIGPEMFGVHTYEEKLSINSTNRTWDLLKAVLKIKSA